MLKLKVTGRNNLGISGICYFIGYWLIWFFILFQSQTGFLAWEKLLCVFLAMLAFVIGTRSLQESSQIEQVAVISSCTFAVLLLACISDLQSLLTTVVIKYIMLLILAGTVVIVIYSFRKIRLWKFRELRDAIVENIPFVVLCTLVLVIFIVNYGTLPLWDSLHTYWHGEVNYVYEIFDLDHLTICTVCRHIYCALNILFSKIFRNVLLGESILQCLMMFLGIFSFYGIMGIVQSSDNQEMDRFGVKRTLLTGIYAFSPFVLGLSAVNNWDCWTFYLMPTIIYFWYKSKYIYHFIFAIILLYTKETGAVSYAGFIVGALMYDMLRTNSKKTLFKARRYVYAIFLLLSWAVIYFSTTGFVGVLGGFTNGHLGVSDKTTRNVVVDFLISRIPLFKNWFILNFNWVLVLGSLLGMVAIIMKARYLFKYILPILTCELFMMIFYFSFFTNPHARYLDTHVPCLCILFCISLNQIANRGLEQLIIGIVTIVFIVQNYCTFDPLTCYCYNQYQVGDSTIICTCDEDEYMSDSIVYNRQYKYYDKALNMAMEIPVNEKALICLPYNSRWFYFASTFYGKHCEEELGYWDVNRNVRTLNSTIDMGKLCGWVSNDRYDNVYGRQNYIEYRGMLIDKEDDLQKATHGEEAYYICNPTYGMDVYEKLKLDGAIINEDVVSYRGWDMIRVKFCYGK